MNRALNAFEGDAYVRSMRDAWLPMCPTYLVMAVHLIRLKTPYPYK